jgi:hypothetical protein
MTWYCSCRSETFSTLRFAQRAKAIKNKAVVNEVMQDNVNHLRQVIRQLRVYSITVFSVMFYFLTAILGHVLI